jgi:hypothetical protein
MSETQGSFISRIHIDPTISMTHILTTISLTAGLILWGMGITQRLAVIESRQQDTTTRIVSILENQRLIDARQDAEMVEMRRVMRDDLRDINVKLDNLLRSQVLSRSAQPND